MAVHRGWVVTDDLRAVDAEDSHVGAVSSSMTPEAYLRLADAAEREELNLGPLLHRISSKGLNGTERFLRDPRLQNSRGVGEVLAPVWIGLANSLRLVRNLALKASNRFRMRISRPRVPGWAVNRESVKGQPLGASRPDPRPVRKQDDPSIDPSARPGSVTNPPPRRQDRQPPVSSDSENLTAKEPNATAPDWSTLHEWIILNATGAELFRGKAVGVEGDLPDAVRARRAPLDEIPGLPKDATIQWPGNPEWTVEGVSTSGTARSVINTARDRLGREFSWPSLRQLGQDLAPVLRGEGVPRPEKPAAEPTAMESALARLRSRLEDTETDAVRDALARLQQRFDQRRPEAGEEMPLEPREDPVVEPILDDAPESVEDEHELESQREPDLDEVAVPETVAESAEAKFGLNETIRATEVEQAQPDPVEPGPLPEPEPDLDPAAAGAQLALDDNGAASEPTAEAPQPEPDVASPAPEPALDGSETDVEQEARSTFDGEELPTAEEVFAMLDALETRLKSEGGDIEGDEITVEDAVEDEGHTPLDQRYDDPIETLDPSDYGHTARL